MEDMLGFVPSGELLDFSRNFLVARPNNPIDQFFPDQKTENLFATYQTLSADSQIPVMATVHAHDTEAEIGNRVPINTVNIEKMLIKRKINQSERMRALMRSGVRDSALRQYILDDAGRLAESVVTRTKVAKAEVMASGKMTVKENNLNLTVDYGVPSENTGFSFDWSAPDADIVKDLQSVLDAATASGQVITGILTSKKILNLIRNNTPLQTLVMGNIGAGAMLRTEMLNDFLSSEYGISKVVTNDLQYGIEKNVDASGKLVIEKKRYYPENKITFYTTGANGGVGVGLWGVTPEEEGANPYTSLSSQQFVTISQWATPDPKAVWTKASGMFIPVLPNPSGLFIATVNLGSGIAAKTRNSKPKNDLE